MEYFELDLPRVLSQGGGELLRRLWQQKILFRTWCGQEQQDSDSKKFYSEPDAVEYNKDSKPLHDLSWWKTMKELGITMESKSQDNDHWWDHLASDSINHLQKR